MSQTGHMIALNHDAIGLMWNASPIEEGQVRTCGILLLGQEATVLLSWRLEAIN